MKPLTWKAKLTLEEVKHLQDVGINTLEMFKVMRTKQLELTRGDKEACWECRGIALKLGVEKAEEKK